MKNAGLSLKKLGLAVKNSMPLSVFKSLSKSPLLWHPRIHLLGDTLPKDLSRKDVIAQNS